MPTGPNKTVLVRFVASVGQYRGSIHAMEADMRRFGVTMQQSSARAAQSTTALARTAAAAGKIMMVALGGSLVLSAKAAMDFESTFAGVRKTVEATEPQFAALAKQLRGLAKVLPINVNELNRIAELGGQLGIGVESIEDFTDTIAKIGVTTVLSTEEAATGFARLEAILGFGQENFDRLGSSIVELGNNFATTEDEILTFALRIAPVGKTVGLTADDVLALSTAFSSVGVPAERGGTAVQRVFVGMAEAVQEGSGELAAFGRVAGMTSKEFATAFERDAAGAFDLFLQGLARIQEEGGNVFATLQFLGLQNVRTIQSMLALANAGTLLSDALGRSEEAWQNNNALAEEAAKRFGTTASKLQIASNNFTDLRISLGEKLLPMLGELAEDMTTLVDSMGETNQQTVDLIGSFLRFGAVGWATTALFKKLKSGFVAVGAASAAAGVKLGVMQTVLLGLTKATLWGAIIYGIERVVTHIGNAVKASLDWKQAVEGLADTLADLDSPDRYTEALESIREAIGEEGIAAFEEAGLSKGLLAQYVLGDEGALRAVEAVVAKLKKDLAPLEEARGLAYDQGDLDRFYELDTLLNNQKDHYQSILGYTQTLNTLYIDAYTLEEKKRKEQEEIQKLLQGELKLHGGLHAAGQRRLAQLREEADILDQDIFEAQRDAADVMDEIVSAMYDYAEATQAVADERNLTNLQAQAEAWDGLTEAVLALGEGDTMDRWVDWLARQAKTGTMAKDALTELAGRTLAMAGAANEAVLGGANYARSLETQARVAHALGVELNDLRRAMGLADADMRRYLSTVMGLAAGMIALVRSTSLAALAQNALRLAMIGADLTGLMRELTAVPDFSGILSGLQNEIKASGGGVKKSMAELAREGVDAYMAAMSAAFGMRRAQRALEEATRAVFEARQRQYDIYRDILIKERELEKARTEAARITLDEEIELLQARNDIYDREREIYELRRELASIPDQLIALQEELTQAQEDYNDALREADYLERQHKANLTSAYADVLRMERAYAQGESSFADLIAAEIALAEELAKGGDAAEARAEAEEEYAETKKRIQDEIEELLYRQQQIQRELELAQLELIRAQEEYLQLQKDVIGPTQEVLDLEDELKDLREDLKDAVDDLTTATWDYEEANLALIEAFLSLDDAQQALLDKKGDWEALFRSIAREAGLAAAAIDTLVRKAGAVPASATVGGGGGGVTPKSPIYLPTVVGATTPTTTTKTMEETLKEINEKLNPPGGILFAQHGALLPGPPTRSYPVVAHGGESILTGPQMDRLLAQAVRGGDSGPGTIIVQFGNREVARFVVDEMMDQSARAVRTSRRVN